MCGSRIASRYAADNWARDETGGRSGTIMSVDASAASKASCTVRRFALLEDKCIRNAHGTLRGIATSAVQMCMHACPHTSALGTLQASKSRGLMSQRAVGTLGSRRREILGARTQQRTCLQLHRSLPMWLNGLLSFGPCAGAALGETYLKLSVNMDSCVFRVHAAHGRMPSGLLLRTC